MSLLQSVKESCTEKTVAVSADWLRLSVQLPHEASVLFLTQNFLVFYQTKDANDKLYHYLFIIFLSFIFLSYSSLLCIFAGVGDPSLSFLLSYSVEE
jgi:Na+-driven multidrug efflux pump